MIGGGAWQSSGGSINARLNALEGKRVRSTRFFSIGSGTSGSVTLPSSSSVVLDDFGGTVDAVVTTISGGRPTTSPALTAGGSPIAATFDSDGNYTLSATPSAYPVALVFRVAQDLSDFDSTSTDIIGPPVISSSSGGGGGTWGSITGTLSDQTDLQSALDLKQDDILGSPAHLVWKNDTDVAESLEEFGINAYRGFQISINDANFGDTESHATHYSYVSYNPTEDAPNATVTLFSTEAAIDTDGSGRELGSTSNALNLQTNFIRAESTGNLGTLAFVNNSFVVGNGTDAIDVKGLSYFYGFGEFRSGTNLSGPIQGYGFQPVLHTGVTLDPNNSYTNAFYDNTNYEVESQYHTSFGAGATFTSIAASRGVTGFNFNPQAPLIGSGASVTGLAVSGTYGTFAQSASFAGVSVNPTITSNRYAVGFSCSMDNVTNYAGATSSVVIQDLTITFNAPADNNSYTVEYLPGGTAGSEIVAISGGNALQITIEDGVSTASQVKSAIEGTISINSAVTVTISGSGPNAQVAEGPLSFTGGENPGRALAAWFDGDVEITGALQFGGALSIGKLNAFSSQAMINGGGTPNSVHSMISNPTVAANTTVALADTIGLNTAMLLTVGANSTVTSAFLGAAALALPAVVAIGASSSIDQVSGGTFAISLDPGGGAGGVIGNLDLCRSLAIPNGITTITKMSGYKFDLPFGNPATTAWGFYESPGVNNYFAGNLLIGGTAGSDDTVTNASVALEVKSTTKAVVVSRMDSTEEGALTATNGMILYNTTTNKFRGYAGGSWVDLH